MYAVILAGGLGTRLRPYTHSIPKPLLPLGERPVLEILLHRLKDCGVSSACLSLGYLAPIIKAFVGTGERWGMDISCIIEEQPLGTAAPLRLVPDLPADFFVVNGDTLTDLDFAKLHRTHRDSNAWATVFTPEIEEVTDYGIIEIAPGDDSVARYIEKPKRRFHVSSGIYALSRRIIDYIPASGRFDMPDLVQRAIAEGRPVRAFRADAYWRDIGRLDHFEMANRDFVATPERFLGSAGQAK
ncbi:MAG: NDP-mannose synthase [Rhodospirillaceae bacterium]|jgi:NDP-sugar pyrophosphorylase family protein|nr:NDP-mannose synthase [Rhodospirillaceae bacterium]